MPPETTPAAARYARLAEALKLGPDATEEEMLAALAELLKAKGTDAPDPAKFVPVETVQAMLAERNLTLATASEGRGCPAARLHFASDEGMGHRALHERRGEL
ncbi:hypothetical protein RNZ50_18655 [Paracoccaceae bacterium Fryx2]|nr:hypothetical protein [Paracoccaceae bacterium Fryx2]